ncbi:MAG TPA: 6-carboxytetrahydropterin synthase [Pseudobdellovibrionaceae bacterium]|nr:6-carboxytetrahydropterin synthase [Pseudobdellovibrionaceae bacterium]
MFGFLSDNLGRMYRLTLAKEDFKFSAAHLTLLSAHEAERLHGHNYQVRVQVTCSHLDEWEFAFEFNTLKRQIRELISRWDERVLIPVGSPYLEVLKAEGRTQVALKLSQQTQLGDKASRAAPALHYAFPSGDVIELPVRNITTEALARTLAQDLANAWGLKAPRELAERVVELEVQVEETRGQSAGFILSRPLDRAATDERATPKSSAQSRDPKASTSPESKSP